MFKEYGAPLFHDFDKQSAGHETNGRSPKTGVRVYTRTPVFGYPLNFREVLIIYVKSTLPFHLCQQVHQTIAIQIRAIGQDSKASIIFRIDAHDRGEARASACVLNEQFVV